MSLTPEKIAALLATPKAAQEEDGAWQDSLIDTTISYNSFDGETLPCDGCGHCPQPGKCAQSVECPACGAKPSTLCKEHTRLVGFHEARWRAAGGTYRYPTEEEKLVASVIAKLKGG